MWGVGCRVERHHIHIREPRENVREVNWQGTPASPDRNLHRRGSDAGDVVVHGIARGDIDARAQRDGGKEVAHLVGVVATVRAVAQTQSAVVVVSCSHAGFKISDQGAEKISDKRSRR